MRTVLLFLACAVTLSPQTTQTYTYEKETSLSGAAETVTIHLSSTSNKTVQFVGAELYCSVACTGELLRDGTAPTTTEATVVPLNGSPNPSARAFHTSNVGSSTHIKYYTIAAGDKETIELPDKGLTAGKNLTLKTNSITGTARIYFQWRER